MGCVPREKKEPNHQKTNFPRRSTRGGGGVTLLGGRTIWGRGEELMREGEWRGIGMKQRGSGRLGKACQGIA
jgi:hypothetical protein